MNDNIEENKKVIKLNVINETLPTGKTYVSFSEMMDWVDCSFRHKLKHIDKIDLQKPSEHLIFGSTVHDAIEDFLKNVAPLDFETTAAKLKEQMKDLEFFVKNPHELDTWINSVDPIFKELPGWLSATFDSYEVIDAEHQLQEPFEKKQGRFFKGFIDVILKYKNKRGEDEYLVGDWKGQRLSAKIMTPYGWTTMGQLKIGDEIIGSNGKPTKVIGIYPLGKRDVYRVWFKDKTFVDCTDDHLWNARRSCESVKTFTTVELQQRIKKQSYFIPVVSKPVEYNMHSKLKIDPYVLGLLIGDGSFVGSTTFTSCDEEIVKNMKKKMPKEWCMVKINTKRKNNAPQYRISNTLKDIKHYNLHNHRSWEKFIPEDYKYSSPRQRLAILQGLLDTDGWAQKGIAKLSTSSFKLANDVKDIVDSLGGTSFICKRLKSRKIAKHDEYIVTINLPKIMRPFRLKRKLDKWNKDYYWVLQRKIEKIEKLDEQDEMQCIKVDAKDQLYVTNNFIVTHNTTSTGWSSSKKNDKYKQMQMILYKYFWCKKMNIDPNIVKCGWVLIKRSPKRNGHFELVNVESDDKATENATDTVARMMSTMEKKLFSKNRNACEYCDYRGTTHCV